MYLGFNDGFYYIYPAHIFGFSDNSKCSVTDKRVPYDPRCRPWYQDVMASGNDSIISTPYLSISPNIMMSSICSEIKYNDFDLIGATCTDIDLKSSRYIASSLPDTDNAYYFIIDPQATVVYHS